MGAAQQFKLGAQGPTRLDPPLCTGIATLRLRWGSSYHLLTPRRVPEKRLILLFFATGLFAGDAKQTNCNCYSLPDFLQVIRAKLHGPNVMLDSITCIFAKLVHL